MSKRRIVKKNRLLRLALPKKLARFAFSIPLAIAAGSSYFKPLNSFFEDHVAILDKWTSIHSPWKWALVVVLFILTVLIAIKQWSYYYGQGNGKAGFFANTCGCFNDREETLDIVLSFWGGLLFVSAVTMPSYWLFLIALYSSLVVLRCWVTLKRKTYAAIWNRKGETSGPRFRTLTSSFPRPQTLEVSQKAGLFEAAAKTTDWAMRLQLMTQSLNWTHPSAKVEDGGYSREPAAKEILAGWLWSHSIFFGTGVTLFVIVVFVEIFEGPSAITSLTTIGFCLVQVMLFRGLSKPGERWGIKHADQLVG